MRANRPLLSSLTAVALALSACGGSPPPSKPPRKPLPAAQPAAPAKATYPGAPATPVGDQLAWVLDVIERRHGKLARAELEAHFAPSFLQEVPADQMLQALPQMADQLPGLVIRSVEGNAERLIAHATVGSSKLEIALALNPEHTQIAALLIRPEADTSKPQTFEDALHGAAQLAPKAQLLVAELDKGECKPLQELAASDELALGSSFKLYVLNALADQVIAGKLKWSDDLTVRDAWKSLPSGKTQNDPAGSKLKVQELAERMIALSDNTAADHLLYTLGRTKVEAALRATKHSKPALDTPFLSTRELFLFKLGTSDAEIERYLKLPEAARRTYLDKTLAGKAPPLDKIAEWKAARRIDKIEWFASSNDLCRVMGTLWSKAQNDKARAVLDVLAKNPGLPIDKKVWPYIGFKGGSEPGVLNMTYLLRRDDDKWFVITLGFNADEGKTLEDTKIYNLATGLIELVGRMR